MLLPFARSSRSGSEQPSGADDVVSGPVGLDVVDGRSPSRPRVGTLGSTPECRSDVRGRARLHAADQRLLLPANRVLDPCERLQVAAMVADVDLPGPLELKELLLGATPAPTARLMRPRQT